MPPEIGQVCSFALVFCEKVQPLSYMFLQGQGGGSKSPGPLAPLHLHTYRCYLNTRLSGNQPGRLGNADNDWCFTEFCEHQLHNWNVTVHIPLVHFQLPSDSSEESGKKLVTKGERIPTQVPAGRALFFTLCVACCVQSLRTGLTNLTQYSGHFLQFPEAPPCMVPAWRLFGKWTLWLEQGEWKSNMETLANKKKNKQKNRMSISSNADTTG